VILADTSAWVEYLRRTGSPVNGRLRDLVADGALAVTEPVEMELLAGRTHDQRRLERLLAAYPLVPVSAAHDYTAAAALYRTARAAGRTPRSLLDCLIAAVAIRRDLPLLVADRDFPALAAVSPLRLDRPGD
jgi:predicted nucleic acid-binding protein